jgi:photosystem II stability/assembly factor-like uncharacterized protein
MQWAMNGQLRLLLVLIIVHCQALSGLAQRITWEKEYLNLEHASLRSVAIVAPNRVVAVGDHSVVRLGSQTNGLSVVYGNRAFGALRSVDVAPSGLLVAVGDDPYLLVSSDSGVTWKRQYSGVPNARAIAFNQSGNSVLISALSGLYYSSGDVSQITLSVSGEFTSVVWTSSREAVAGSLRGDILTSSDSGRSWSKIARLSSSAPVRSISYFDGRLVIVRDNSLTVAISGSDTTDVIVDANPYITFKDAIALGDTMVAVGEYIGASHMFSTNAGRSWDVVDLLDSDAGWAIDVRLDQFAIVGGVGTYRLGNTGAIAGTSFAKQGFGSGNKQPRILSFQCVRGGDSKYFCFSNSNGVRVLHIADSSRAVTDLLPQEYARGVIATDLLAQSDTIVVVADSFRVASEGGVSRASYRHIIFTTTDSGKNWSTLLAPDWDSRLQWISRDRDGRTYVSGGESAYVIDLQNNSASIVTCDELREVASLVAASDTMLAVGNRLCLSYDAGVTWIVLPAPFIESNVRRLVQAGVGRIIAFESAYQAGVGGQLSIWTTDDWGKRWTRSGQFNSDAMINPSDFNVMHPGCILAVGQSASVYYSTDNGTTWSADNPPINRMSNLYGAQWIDTKTIRVSGEGESIYRGSLDAPSSVRVDNQQLSMNVELFPNPAKDFLTARITGRDLTSIELYDAALRQISCSHVLLENIVTVDVGSIPKGAYILTLRTVDSVVSVTFIRQ